MVTNGTYLRSFLANDNVAAVGTLPDDITVFGEYTLFADVVQQFAVALLMGFLDGCNTFKLLGNLVETLVTGLTGQTGIHVGPLEVLTTSGSLQIAGGILDATL